MKQPLLLVILVLLVMGVYAQQGDFIVIKKKGVSFKTFFTGSQVTFMSNRGDWISGKVYGIRNDSIFFKEMVVRQVPTPWGVPRLDTMTSFIRSIYYRDIVAIPKKKESFSYIKNGTLFMIGGGGFILLNVVNSAYLHYPIFGSQNLPGLLVAAGFLGGGFLLKKLHKRFITIDHNYSIEYVKVGPSL